MLLGNIDLFVNWKRSTWDDTDTVPENAGCVRSAGHGMRFVLALAFN